MVSLHTLAIPPLENGDRLTRPEFERRYQATPEHCKAELIEGVVYMASPVRVFHGTPHFNLITWLGVYGAATAGVSGSDNATTLLDQNNELQPDALLRIEVGGRSSLSEEGYIEGAPELVAEVATSSAAIDLGTKKEVYRRNGVQEYLVWQTFGNRLDWFQLEAEQFVAVEPDAEGIIRSRVFPGLWLAVPALLAGNMLEVLTVLQRGIADPSHQAFVERLQVQS
ncbi:MAG: Uma2 family endonuclease [Prochlorotrichaceae cyanobacterium]